MSPSLPSSESSGPCSRFIAGAGRKGNRCSTCHKKERHHRSSTIPPQAALSNLSSHSSGPTDSPSSTPQTTTIAPPLTTDSSVQAIINRYGAGGTGMQLRPRTAVGPVPAKSEASSGFRKNVVSSSFPKVRIPDLLRVQMLLTINI
jgi:hypothetical protein